MKQREVDTRQLNLFDKPLPLEDPVAVLYRRCRQHTVWLEYDRATRMITARRWRASVPNWVVTAIRRMRQEIEYDLLRALYGIEPELEVTALPGGAVLHRLPRRYWPPEREPPVKSSLARAAAK